MKKSLRRLAGAAAGAVVALGFTSCAYDPYYSSASVGGTYSSGGGSYGAGYGQGYGYGGSGFSTSIFVGTGNPQWGYDPNCYSYYDYNRRCYYDPYLNGYYPVGYRPPVVYGVPHPYGWQPGSSYCRPPSYVNNATVVNYRHREDAYHNTNYGWAKQVRQQPVNAGRVQGQRPPQNSYNSQNSYARQTTGGSSYGNAYTHSNQTRTQSSQTRTQSGQAVRQSPPPSARQKSGSRLPSSYYTPVTTSPQRTQQGQRAAQYHPGNHPKMQQPQGNRQQAQPTPQGGNHKNNGKKSADDDGNRTRGYR